jgi:hypothetical protein
MSFEAVWGFDPERVSRSQSLFQQGPSYPQDAFDEEPEEYSDPVAARIPLRADEQVYELRRLFRS